MSEIEFDHNWLEKEISNGGNAICDSENHIAYGFLKNVSYLSLTYPLKYFALKAWKENKLLIIRVPEVCEVSPQVMALKGALLMEEDQELIRILRLK